MSFKAMLEQKVPWDFGATKRAATLERGVPFYATAWPVYVVIYKNEETCSM